MHESGCKDCIRTHSAHFSRRPVTVFLVVLRVISPRVQPLIGK